MWSVRLGGVLLAVLVYSCAAQDYTEWIKAIENEEDLGVANLVFNCSEFPDHPKPTVTIGEGDSQVQVPPYNFTIDEPQSWMLPNLTILHPGVYGNGKIIISSDAQQMTIYNVTKEDFGIYHCMVWVTSDDPNRYYLVKWGVNMRGPYFENLWDKYRTNTIIALSASGGFTAFMIIVCLVWQYHWRPPGDDSSDKDGYPDKPKKDGVPNLAYTKDEFEEQPTTSSGSVYNDYSKPPLPVDSFAATPTPTVTTYSSFNQDPNPNQALEVEADTRF